MLPTSEIRGCIPFQNSDRGAVVGLNHLQRLNPLYLVRVDDG